MSEWRPLPGYEGLYRVSDLGQVYSIAKKKFLSQRWTKQRGQGSNYLRVNVWKDGKKRNVRVHTAVLTAFVGPRPAGHQCRHLDGDPNNNKLSNLKWGTRKENAADMRKHGNTPGWLTDEQVLKIRRRRADGEKLTVLAKEFGVSTAAISSCCLGNSYAHLPLAEDPNARRKPRLTREQILEIRRLAVAGRSLRSISAAVGVARSTVASIANRNSKYHLKPDFFPPGWLSYTLEEQPAFER